MEFRTPPISPLRQRMLEDMRMRKFQPHTQTGYIRAVLRLTHFLERSPDTATADDLRRFQVHLADDGATPSTINATLSGLKFFFEVTVGQGEVMAKVAPVRLPQNLPVVLSREEVTRLLGAVTNLKHHTALSVAYGTGLRASDVRCRAVSDHWRLFGNSEQCDRCECGHQQGRRNGISLFRAPVSQYGIPHRTICVS